MEEQPAPEVMPIVYTRRMALTVEVWPQRTAFTEEYLGRQRPPHVRVEGDTVFVYAHNGIGTYQLKRDEPLYGDGIVADLVDGEAPAALRRRVGKYENPARGVPSESDEGG